MRLMQGVTLYLVVRDTDGAILAEFDSPASALRALLEDEQLAAAGVSLIRYEDRQGEVIGTTSYVTTRPANLDRVQPSRPS
jgi:hypothetical protein